MRIIPVIDLLDGLVVRGIGGRRDAYRPIVSQIAADATASSVASAFRKLGCGEVYVADLDAIAGAEPAWRLYDDMSATGLTLWVDAGRVRRAGVRSQESGDKGQESGGGLGTPHRVVVGLESLENSNALGELVEAIGHERLVFSLDLKHGLPLTLIGEWRDRRAVEIAAAALELGVRSLIVLDLANVGMEQGVATLSLCRQIRQLDATVELISGGGVRNHADLDALADAGCDAALVASALHDGRLP